MKKSLYLMTCILLIISCGVDTEETERNLQGTWMLEDVSGECSSLPVVGSADEMGCIPNPLLEINCLLLDFGPNGVLSYSSSLNRGEGSYTVNGDKITVCAMTCLEYRLADGRLTMQTGTLPECDPVYTFVKSSISIDDFITINGRRSISSVRRNGVLQDSYSYTPDGALESHQRYDESGNLQSKHIYTYTPITATVTSTNFELGYTESHLYYNESPTRVRRDRLSTDNELASYRLYFLSENDCLFDRVEDYNLPADLFQLTDYQPRGNGCDYDRYRYRLGELVETTTYVRDNMKFYATSTLLSILQYKDIGNIKSLTRVVDGEVSTSTSYASTFTYDELGFPTQEIRQYLDGSTALYTYQYE